MKSFLFSIFCFTMFNVSTQAHGGGHMGGGGMHMGAHPGGGGFVHGSGGAQKWRQFSREEGRNEVIMADDFGGGFDGDGFGGWGFNDWGVGLDNEGYWNNGFGPEGIEEEPTPEPEIIVVQEPHAVAQRSSEKRVSAPSSKQTHKDKVHLPIHDKKHPIDCLTKEHITEIYDKCIASNGAMKKKLQGKKDIKEIMRILQESQRKGAMHCNFSEVCFRPIAAYIHQQHGS